MADLDELLAGDVAEHGPVPESLMEEVPQAWPDPHAATDAQAQPAAPLVLDSEGLSKAATGDRRVVAWIAPARERQLPLVVNAVTLTEALHGGGGGGARVHLLTKNAHVDTVDANFASEAGRPLGRTRRSNTVDALVATAAIRLNRPTTILTSDARDLGPLTSEYPLVRVVPI